ncbi:hypothetical protein NGB36_31680 [Streptomyces sp. RB6PN25]|uniref:Cysteinyl-tRNA synthetase n=1 Tax=Streptomyces humicola TaxID=2953240 RepID=A0ABT1Q6J4_9ACTN|nr:hypothetical protein [Streptomyces humicola]MCQ4085000.1 hypothetical protein [Streptomyces humicola]
MRITDARTGLLTRIRPARTGLLYTRVQLTRTGAPFGTADLRALLVADVLFRLAEFNGLQVMACWADAGHAEDEVKALARDAERLGVHPPAAHVGDERDGPCDVHVVAHTAATYRGPDGPEYPSGPDIPVAACGPVTGAGGYLDTAGNDPLAMRLALLEHPYSEPVRLDREVLAAAQDQLSRWRERVAAWAEMPSRPSHPDVVRNAFTAFSEGLDTWAALAELRRLEGEPGVPDGSRFETFVYLDRILGLELPRAIGRACP